MPQSMYAARARLSALKRYRPDDDPAVTAARAELREAKLADHIKSIVDDAPPLSPEQRSRLAVLLLSPSGRTPSEAA